MYNKLFTKILDSSIWLESVPTRLLWITLLAAMDEDGMCQFASIGNLAHRARMTKEDAEAAIACLEAPDPDSSDPENDGRRIERVPGGWIVLNAAKYRDLVTREVAKEKTRVRVARFREGKRSETVSNAPVTPVKRSVTPSEAVTETSTKATTDTARKARATLAEVTEFCLSEGLTQGDAEAFFHGKEANGWKNGNTAIKDWKATIRSWKAASYHPSQKGNGRQNGKPSVSHTEQSEWGI